MIDRWAHTQIYDKMMLDDTGHYVKHADHLTEVTALQEEVERLKHTVTVAARENGRQQTNHLEEVKKMRDGQNILFTKTITLQKGEARKWAKVAQALQEETGKLTTALEFYASPCYWVFLKALKGVTLLQSYRRDLLEDKGKRAREALSTEQSK